MTLQEAKEIIKDWEKHEQETDFPNQFINDLLEAQKVVERERAAGIVERIIQEERYSGAPFALNKAKQEILQSTKE